MNDNVRQGKAMIDTNGGIQQGSRGSKKKQVRRVRRVHEQVTRKSGAKVPGVYIRDGVYYSRVVDPVSGKRRWVRAIPQTIDAAARYVKECKTAVGAGRAAVVSAALDATKVRSEWPVVADLIEQYERAADIRRVSNGSPRLATQVDAIARLRQIITEYGFSESKLALDRLSEVAEGWARDSIKSGANRNSVSSTLRIARSVFARWARVEYSKRGFRFPAELADHWPAVTGKVAQYKLQPQALRDATIAGGFAEIDARTNVGIAFALCFCGALSRVDAVAAEWSWIRDNGHIVYTRNKTGRRADPMLPAEVFEALKSWPGRDARAYVLPGDTKTAREDIIDKHLNPWMRELGWETRAVAHELRKLACSIWTTRCGIGWAARWIGDTEATAAAYYSELLPEEAPNPWA